MTPSLWLRDIASLAIQLTFVVCAGAAAFYALRIRDARISLIYWRGLLLLCLVLPLVSGAGHRFRRGSRNGSGTGWPGASGRSRRRRIGEREQRP